MKVKIIIFIGQIILSLLLFFVNPFVGIIALISTVILFCIFNINCNINIYFYKLNKEARSLNFNLTILKSKMIEISLYFYNLIITWGKDPYE